MQESAWATACSSASAVLALSERKNCSIAAESHLSGSADQRAETEDQQNREALQIYLEH
jgi:hypothetical protein